MKIDSLTIQISNYKDSIVDYKVSVNNISAKQNRLEMLADSLRNIAETKPNLPCKDKLRLKTYEANVLRGALKKCKKAKAIQVKTINSLEVVVKKQDTLCVNRLKLQKSHLQTTNKSKFWLSVGVGAIIIGLIVLF